MSNVVTFPLASIVWRAIEAAIQDEAQKNCHIGSGHIRFGTSKALERIAGQLAHIPRDVLSREVQKLSEQMDETVAQTNVELRRVVYQDRIRNRCRS